MIYAAQGSGDQLTYQEFMKESDEKAAKIKSLSEKLTKAFNSNVHHKTVGLDQHFETSVNKNKPCALDGSVRDTVTVLQHSKYLDSISKDIHIILSHTM